MPEEVTLGGISLDIGADEKDFAEAGAALGREAAAAIKDSTKTALSAAKGPATGTMPTPSKGGGGFPEGVGAGASLAGFAKRAGTGVAVRAGGAGAGAVIAGAGAATAATGGAALPVIIGLAAAGVAIFAFVKSMSAINKKMNSELSRLAGLNADLAVAAITKTIGQLNRDLDRASLIGPVVREVVEIVERMKDKLAPLGNVVLAGLIVHLKIFLQALEVAAQAVLKVVDITLAAVAAFTRGIADLVRFLSIFASPFGFLGDMLADKLDGIADSVDKTREWLQEEAEGRSRNDDLNRIFASQAASLAGRGVSDVFPITFPPDPFSP
jgi:hypothetical protein